MYKFIKSNQIKSRLYYHPTSAMKLRQQSSISAAKSVEVKKKSKYEIYMYKYTQTYTHTIHTMYKIHLRTT